MFSFAFSYCNEMRSNNATAPQTYKNDRAYAWPTIAVRSLGLWNDVHLILLPALVCLYTTHCHPWTFGQLIAINPDYVIVLKIKIEPNEIPYIHEVLQGYQGGVGKTSRLLDGDAEQFLIVHATRPIVKQGLFLTLISGITAGHGFVRYSRHWKFK